MNKKLICSILLFAFAVNVKATEHAAHWGYEGETSPAHWAEMSEKFRLCGSGKNQSPINIETNFDVALEPIAFSYEDKVKKVVNNGHTIQVNIADGSRIIIEDETFTLKQFHFHTPSENTINDKHFPLEAHFVHRNGDKNTYAVIAVMFEEGDENPLIEQIWQAMPSKARTTASIDADFRYSKLMPDNKDYYRFNGSFTTPPCTEGVKWLVLKKPMTLSKKQIKQFFDVMGHSNNRNIQETGARVIVE